MLLGGMAGLTLLGGCGQNSSAGAGASGSAAVSESESSSKGVDPFIIGTLPTEDILPFWVANEEGLYDEAGVTAEVVPFQSATELIAGVSSGDVDLAMTDIMVTASIFASGTDVAMKWITLGATSDQGRFGIMSGPNSQITSVEQLAGVPIDRKSVV